MKKWESFRPKRETLLRDNLTNMPQAHCAHGCKKNAKGHTDHWIGYMLHLSTGDGDERWSPFFGQDCVKLSYGDHGCGW